jgi:hypothetical protein
MRWLFKHFFAMLLVDSGTTENVGQVFSLPFVGRGRDDGFIVLDRGRFSYQVC